jgi:hypothetical protein
MKKRLFLIGLALILVTFTDAQRRKYGYDPDKYPEVIEKGLFKDADNLEKLFGFIDGEKIRAVSISDGISRKNTEIYERWQGLLQKAEEQ